MTRRQRFCRRLRRAINRKTASINLLALAALVAPTEATRRTLLRIRREQVEHRRILRAIRDGFCMV